MPVAATMLNMTSPVVGKLSTSVPIFGIRQHNHDQPARYADEAQPHFGHADKSDVLRERGIGEGVENPPESAQVIRPSAQRPAREADRLYKQIVIRKLSPKGFRCPPAARRGARTC